MNNQLFNTKVDLNSQITFLQSTVSALRNTVTSLGSNLTTLRSTVAQNQQSVEASLQSLQNKLTSVSSQLNSTEANDASALSSITTQLQNITQSLSSLTQQVSSLAQSGVGLYIVSVEFSGSNVTVNLGNSGGGVPTPPGYGDTGAIARYIGAIIIQDGSVYYHYNWNCQLNTPCALSPGPYRYFTLTGTTSSVNATWNLGKSSLVPDILSVGGSLDAGVIFPWTSGGSYTIYIQSNSNLIVYQASFTAP